MRANRWTRWVAAAALAALSAASTGCGYMGSATSIDPAQFDLDTGWIAVKNIRFQPQEGDNDCGAASLAMVLTHWGLPSTPQEVAVDCPLSVQGSRAGDLRDLVRNRGLRGFLIRGTLDDLIRELSAKRPVIVGLVKPYVSDALDHYEVVVAINPAKKQVATLDPARGPRQNTYDGFLQEWEPARYLALIVIGNGDPRLPGPGP